MRFAYENKIENGLLTAESEYSVDTFPVKNILDRRTGKRWRSYRAPNLMLHGNCDSADAPTLDGTPAAASGGTWARDESIKYEGTSSWKHVKTTASGSGSTNVWFQDGVSSTDMHGLTAGKTYEMTIQLRGGQGLTTATNAGIRFYAYYGAAWNIISGTLYTLLNEWEFTKAKFTIPANATGIYIRMFIYDTEVAGTCIWADDIKIYESNDLIEHGDCENATYGPTLSGILAAPINCNFFRSNARFYSGAYSWRMEKTTAAGGGSTTQYLASSLSSASMYGAVAGTTYQLKCWLWSNAAPASYAVLYIYEYYNAMWNTTAINMTQSSAWERIERTFTINTATTGFCFRLALNSDAPLNTVLHIDDLEFIPESRLTIDLYSADAPQYAALIGHNLSSSATVYVQANTTATWTTPAVSESVTLADLMLHTMTNATAYRYWSFVFYDNDYNEDGYIELGYGALGDYFQPTNGAARVFQESPDDMSAVNTSITGEVLGSVAGLMDAWEINLPMMDTATKTLFETMYAEVRNHIPFVFVLDQSLTALFPPKYVYFVGSTPYKFTHIMTLDKWACSFTIKECI